MGDDRSAGGSGDRAAAVLGVVVACLVGAGLAVWRTPVLYRSEALIAERMREGRSMRAAEAVALGLIDALVEEPWRASGG